MSDDPRRLVWDGAWNTRHLGGFSAGGRLVTRADGLVRSGNLSRLKPDGQAAVETAGVSAIIDVRSAYELDIEANPYAARGDGANGPKYHHLALMNEDDREAVALVNASAMMTEMYRVMLDRFQDNIGAVMTAIASAPPGAVVVHCHAGKDRTGLVVALALRLAGVSLTDIAQDYALSDTYLQPVYEEMLNRKTDPEERAVLAAQLTSKPETILGALDYVEQHYGGVEAYLGACGLDEETLARLRQRLVEELPEVSKDVSDRFH